ncbi:MAG: hypothetical protein FJ117_22325 [Deltaproteobacteria bacterium]|nr:hypothetical protein [Deltaproteobacteria bacterium]
MNPGEVYPNAAKAAEISGLVKLTKEASATGPLNVQATQPMLPEECARGGFGRSLHLLHPIAS